MRRLVLLLALYAAFCAAPPPAQPPAAAPAPPPPAQSPATSETVTGSGHVNASVLNVRSGPSMSGEVIGHARRGERVAILEQSGDWLRVRLGGGEVGWVSAQHVARDDAPSASSAARGRRGCPPDSDYRFVTAPRPSFSELGAHGVVTIEANVDARGNVTSTRLVSNTTGDDAMAALAAREISAAKFAPPIRNCTPRAFVFTYRRAF